MLRYGQQTSSTGSNQGQEGFRELYPNQQNDNTNCVGIELLHYYLFPYLLMRLSLSLGSDFFIPRPCAISIFWWQSLPG